MKTKSKLIISYVIGLTIILSVGLFIQRDLFKSKNTSLKSEVVLNEKENNQKLKIKEEKTGEEKIENQVPEKKEEVQLKQEVKEQPVSSVPTDPIVYDGLTMNQLAEKLNRSLNSTIAGTGYIFASKSLELGVDPYLAVAIVLHETGCTWNCSELVNACNNVGGMQGSPSCGGGAYAAFPTLEDGISSYLNNLYHNYYAMGLTTPETIGPKYAASTSWPSKINWYISSIREK